MFSIFKTRRIPITDKPVNKTIKVKRNLHILLSLGIQSESKDIRIANININLKTKTSFSDFDS